ncbi:MAG: hypothetical protein ACKVOX_03195 [Rhizobacter sp.]
MWPILGGMLLLMVVYGGTQHLRKPVQAAPVLSTTDASHVSNPEPVRRNAEEAIPAPVAKVRDGKSKVSAAASAVKAATLSSARSSGATSLAPPPEAGSPAKAPAPVPASAVAVTQTPQMPSAAEPGVADLRETCGKRGFIARSLCINERCAQVAHAGDAECVKLRKAAEEAEQAVQRGG